MPEQEALIRQLYVKVDGSALDAEIMDDLHRVTVESSLHLPDLCVLTLHDENAAIINDGPFTLGVALEIGVSDEQGRGEETIFQGEITALEPAFSEGMIAELTVRGYDRGHRLLRGTHNETYTNVSASDVASQIARRLGLRADVDTTSTTYEHIYQDAETDMSLLRRLAAACGFDLHVEAETLCFKEPTGQEQAIALEWGEQLRSFRPLLTLSEQVDSVRVQSWDPENKQQIVGEATSGEAAPEIGQKRQGGQVAGQAFGEALDLVVRNVVRSQEEADQLAQSLLDERNGAYVEAEGLCDGLPTLKAGSLIEVSALGDRFNGRYRITSATHLWDTDHDYVTRFTVSGRRPDTLQSLLVEREEQGPRWTLMPAIVTNNSDPDEMGRVKVKFPWLNDEAESYWARVVSPGAGDSRGICWLPEVNDEVLVGFEQGSMARPFVLGGLWNGVDALPAAASDLVANGNVVQRVLVTRAGHKLVFSDENPAQIILETAGGHQILLNDDDGKLELTTPGGNTLTLDDNATSLEIKGGQVNVEASQNLGLKAQGNLEIEASGNVTIKGAIVQLNP